MRIFLYEHLTAGGAWTGEKPSPKSLLAEGLAMLRALGGDLARVEGVELTVLRDYQLEEGLPGRNVTVTSDGERGQRFADAVNLSDGVILIAPETDGVLLRLAEQVEALGGGLLSPGSAFVALAGDKERTAAALAAAGVPVSTGEIWRAGAPLPPGVTFPAIVKPRNGCGSQDVRLVHSANELPTAGQWRLEVFCPGLAASVAVLCNPAGRFIALPACTQRLSNDGRFSYLGGSTPLPATLDARAGRLALRAVIAILSFVVPPLGGPNRLKAELLTAGYVGVDLVLGDNPSGTGDAVIEVNPRLTTSYVGLRALCRGNLGEAMVRHALGENLTIEFDPGEIEFDPSGMVRRLHPRAIRIHELAGSRHRRR